MHICTWWNKRLIFALSLSLTNYLTFAQEKTVTGTITSAEEGSLPSVNILIQGTTQGTVSDIDGSYEILLSDPEAVLIFSSIGYITQTMVVGNQSTIDIVMDTDVTSLEQVIVTGYTSQSKKDITGAISTVSNDKLMEVPATSFTQQLQGRVTGVTVGQDNRPGGEPVIRVRGWGTINDNDPLYVIDGVPTKNEINSINPANIESVQILKDASAASIYGSRAANGVIIVTTKKGKSGTPKITFDVRGGMQYPTKGPDMLNTQEAGEFYYRAARNDWIAANGSDDGFVFTHGQYGADPDGPDFIPDYIFPSGAFEGDPGTDPNDYSLNPYHGITRANKTGTNWYDEKFDPAPIQEYNFGINGGNESARYFVSLNYFNQQGVIIHTNYERFTLRVNTEFSPKSWFRVGETLEVSYSNSVNTFSNDVFTETGGIYSTSPMSPVYDINGYYASRAGSDISFGNPVARQERIRDNASDRWRIFGGAYIEADIISDLTFKSQLGIDYRNYYLPWFVESGLERGEVLNSPHDLGVDYNFNLDWTWYNTLNYTKSFNDIHRINILAGTEAIDQKYRDLGARRSGFFSTDVNYRFLDAGTTGILNSGSGSESSLFSLFAKVNYVYRDKYLFDATVRRDGSSRFSENNQYATFPSFSVGWRVSEEPFLNSAGWITDLKLRASWGQMGNQEIADYNKFYTYRSSLFQSAYDIRGTDNQVEPGFDSQRFGNPRSIWETTTTLDFGFDWTIWNKLTVNFDWYDMTTTDMLYVLTLPGTRGSAAYPFQNVGEMNNKGIDLGINWHSASANGDFNYDIALNISHYKNKIVKLSDNAAEGFFGRDFGSTRSEAGVPYSSFFGYIIDGFTDGTESADAFPGYYGYGDGKGRFKYRDIDGDTVITPNDRTFIGNPHPDFTFGLSFNANYKSFDFALFFQGSKGNDLINYVNGNADFFSTTRNNNSRKAFNESWTAELGDRASLPIVSANDIVSTRPSTYFVEDGSYIRLKNLQFGYTIANLRGVDRLRVYFQAINLFTITDYSGLDPEINRSGAGSNNANLGLDFGYTPSSQQFLMGLNFGF